MICAGKQCSKPATDGYKTCADCREYFREAQRRHYAANRAKVKQSNEARRKARRAKQLCVVCATPTGGKRLCVKHNRMRAQATARLKRKNRK